MGNIWGIIVIGGGLAAYEIFKKQKEFEKQVRRDSISSFKSAAEKEEFGKKMNEQKKLHQQLNNKQKDTKLEAVQEAPNEDEEVEEEEKKDIELAPESTKSSNNDGDESKKESESSSKDEDGNDTEKEKDDKDDKELTKEEKEKLEKEEEERKDREEEEKEREKLLAELSAHKAKMKWILYILIFIDTIFNTLLILPKQWIDEGGDISITSFLDIRRLFDFTEDTYDLLIMTFIRIELLLWFIDVTIEFGDIKNYDQEQDNHRYFDIKRITKIHQSLAWLVTQFIDAHSDDSDSSKPDPVKKDSASSTDENEEEDEEKKKLIMKQTFDSEDIIKKYDNTAAEDVADFWKASLWIITFLCLTVFQTYMGVKIVFFSFPLEYQSFYSTMFCCCILIGHFEVYFAKKYIDDACKPHNQYFNSDVHAHPLYKKKAKGNWCELCWEKQKTGDIYNCRQCHRHFCRKCWKKKKQAKQTGENQLRSDGEGAGGSDKDVTIYEYFYRVAQFHIPQMKWLMIGVVAMFTSSVIGVFAPKQTGKLLDKIIEGDVNGFYKMCTVSVIFTVVTGFVSTLNTRSMQRVNEQIYADVQERLFGALLSQDMAFYDGCTPNNLYQRMDWGLRQMLDPFQGLVKTILVSFVTLIGSILMCWTISWKLTLLGLSTLGPMSYISMLFSRWSRSQMSVQWKLRSELWNIMWGSFDNIKTVRAFAREPLLTDYYRKLRREQLDKKLKSAYMTSINQTINSWIHLASRILVTWSAGLLILKQKELQEQGQDISTFDQILTVGAFVTFREYWGKLTGVIHEIRRRITSFDQARFMAKQIFRTLDNQPSIERAKDVKYKNVTNDPELDGSIELEDIDGDITFEDVHFHYQMSPKKKVLKGVDLRIPRGKVTALVGRSGGGKSTMMHLLLRFYDPKKGKICINGVDIRKYNPYSLRRLVSLVAQDNEMFSQSIEFNISYGVDMYNQKGIEEASTLANAHDFIEKFDDKYDSRMGSRGTRVSGGQKQRINIARMLMAKPKLMLLDEATSALDAESEALVQAALDDAIAESQCTVVLVAHRLSTVVNADKICVVDDGEIVEEGTHDELIEKDGIYARLVSRQMNLQSKMKEKVDDVKNGKPAKPANKDDYDNIDKLIEQIKKEKEEEKKKKAEAAKKKEEGGDANDTEKKYDEDDKDKDNDDTDTKIEEEEDDNNETWDKYDDLKLSDDDENADDENEEEEETKEKEMSSSLSPLPTIDNNGGGLKLPIYQLKTQGSVVDMLMDGPSSKRKSEVSHTISITPPNNNNVNEDEEDTKVQEKNYSITVSSGDKDKDTAPDISTDETKEKEKEPTSIFECEDDDDGDQINDDVESSKLNGNNNDKSSEAIINNSDGNNSDEKQ